MTGPIHWLRTSWNFVFEVGKRWYYGGIGDLAASITFWILLTLPAAVLAMISALSSLDNLLGQNLSDEIEDDVSRFIEQVFASDARAVSDTVAAMFNQQNAGLLTFSLGVSFWTISRGFSGLIRALDDVYEVKDGRAWYVTRIVGLVLGLGSLLVSVPIVLLEFYVWSEVEDGAMEQILRTLSAMVILIAWASMIFHFGPSVRTKWRWDLPGAVVAASFWWGLTNMFQYYVRLSSGSNQVLSTVGASLLALTWVWLAAQVLLIGAAVNYVLGDILGLDRRRRDIKISDLMRTGEMRKIDVTEDLPQPPGTFRD